ncbi:MBL fold metallo-hydrolase [Nitrosophilus kaiyonis]|uniref:MBL fold metallo-hydrolase n=1 Tax=Nitrosophilus kaiyonis TaxID=2930200 RepID=UPI0024930C3E|nr:MBL fold metallo-hydrolase [Nitrosophilus kaiyonis]
MNLKYRPMGDYQTNCYILSINENEIIIDPGMGATPWIEKNVKNPVAILNTHGHFDHVWSNAELKRIYNIPIYIHKKDAFLLEIDQFNLGMPKSHADVLIDNEDIIQIKDFKFRFLHFPGHTPGCCVIEFDEAWFSGDFIFKGSIGRVDLPYSNPQDMKNSLIKFKNIPYDKPVYPGHGGPTTIKEEQRYVDYWLKAI